MELNSQRIPIREQVILVGLYLSKFDSLGLRSLGFESFVEAFNAIGYATRRKPASIKNYRDEFDPLFPNPRKGWHKRQTRDYCLKLFEEYKDLDLESFTGLITSFFGYYRDNVADEVQANTGVAGSESSFANRLITGLAAEQYFERIQPSLPQFESYALENTTRLGCGYDFRLRTGTCDGFLAIEVKGLKRLNGGVSLTPKEHSVATNLKERFFLFVVKNFEDSPSHEIFQNPLSGELRFKRRERVMVQVSWVASI